MSELDLDEYDAPSRGGGGHLRPRAAGGAAVRALVRRLAWADQSLVYWTGRAGVGGPAAKAVQARLAGLPVGVYAVAVVATKRTTDRDDRDAVRLARLAEVSAADPMPITPAVIAWSIRRLAELQGYPKLLPTIVGDVALWRAKVEAALHGARTAIDAVAQGRPAQAGCLVIGRCVTVPVARHPLAWPIDVLAGAERRVGAARLLCLAREASGLSDDEVVSAIRGQLLVSPGTLGAFLDALPDLLSLHDRLADEPSRRLRVAAAIQGTAVGEAFGKVGVGGPIALGTGRPTRGQIDFYDGVRRRHQRSVDEAVRRYYSAVLPGVSWPRHSGRQPKHGGAVNPLGLLTDLFLARGLRSALLGGESPADRRRYLGTATVDGRPVALGPDGLPLQYETLPTAAAAALGADAAARRWPRRPLARATVLDGAVAGSIPLRVPWTWVETCCHAWPPGNTGLGPATAVLLSLATVTAHAGDVAGMLGVLDRFAGTTVRHALMNLQLLADVHRGRRGARLTSEVRMLCLCVNAGLVADDLQPFVEHDVLDVLRHAAEEMPQHLLAIGRRMSACVRQWAAAATTPDASEAVQAWQLTGHQAATWCMAFEQLGPALLDRFVHRVGASQPAEETAAMLHRLRSQLEDTPTDRRPVQRAMLAAGVAGLAERLAGSADEAARLEVRERFLTAFIAADVARPADADAAVELFQACVAVAPPKGFLPYLEDRDQAAVAALAMGRADRLMAIAALPRHAVASADAAHVAAGWSLLRGASGRLAEAVSAALGRDGLTLRIVRAVGRLGLCLRFHRGEELRATLTPFVAGVGARGAADRVAELERWRGELPGRVREAVERPTALQRELEGLQRRGELSAKAMRRLEHVRAQLADPAALAAWVQRDLEKLLPAALDEARIARLETLADGAIRGHFREVLGVRLPEGLPAAAQRNWDNALRLYLTTDRNRTRLRWLLRRESRGARAWAAAEPRNARFLAAVARAGVNVAVWRGPMVRRAADAAGRPLRVELETDPLHVLQMGNYFGTCLSEGNINAFSTIANATDVNKRVAYVYDGRGTVVGRKLLVMLETGQIVGFRTYGAVDRPDATGDADAAEAARVQMKDVVDQFCAELARRCGGSLHPYTGGRGSAPEPGDDEMTLAAEWYNDGAEPFETRSVGSAIKRRSAKANEA